MIHVEDTLPEKRVEFIPTAETKYLITDIEKLVNENADAYLRDAPAYISVKGYEAHDSRGHTPYGINRLRQSFPTEPSLPRPELIDMDFSFCYPIEQRHDTPLEVWVNWSNNLSTVILADQKKTALLTYNRITDATSDATLLDADASLRLLESLDVPNKITGDSLQEVVENFSDTSELAQLSVRQIAQTAVDPSTGLSLVYESTIRNDEKGVQRTEEELRIEVDHAHEIAHSNNTSGKNFQTYSRRTMLRFERTQSAEDEATEPTWSFRGSYRGRLAAGQEILQDTEYISDVAIPADRTLQKALYALSNPPEQAEKSI